MTNTTHPARRLRHGDRPTEPLVFEDAAANKAAEEGELMAALTVFDMGLGFALCHKDFGEMRSAVQKLNRDFVEIRTLIAADRAARPVANKAEVEPVYPVHQVRQVRVGGGVWTDVDSEMYDLYNGKPYEKRTLYATPPATTGASTVLTDERIKEEMHAYFSYSGDSDNKFWAHIDDIVLFAHWVAAQAGQVAVPGWVSVDDHMPEFRHECTSSGCEVSDSLMVYGQNEFGTTGCGFGHARDNGTWATYEAEYDQLTVVKVTHWMPLPASPSPAKESK